MVNDDLDMDSVRALASVLSNRSRIAEELGVTFGGKRNVSTALGYKQNIDIKDYLLRYHRNEIAGRVIDTFPTSTWRRGTVVDDEDPQKVTGFEEDFTQLDKRLHIWSKFCAADKLAGIGRFAVILIMAPGKMDSPLPKNLKLADIKQFRVFGEPEVKIDELRLEKDESSERFGMPNYYKISRIIAGTLGSIERDVHYTRIIHVTGEAPTDDILYTRPRLERIWNRLDDLDKLAGGGSEAYWSRVNPPTIINIDPSVKMDPTKITELETATDELVHGQRKHLAQKGVTTTQLQADTSDFKTNVDAILSLISAGTSIPQRLLMGSERGQLASGQDKTNYDDRVSDRRDEYASPLLRDFNNRMVECGAFRKPTNEDYDIWWPEEDELDEKEKATVVKMLASAVTADGEVVWTADELRDYFYDMEPLDREAMLGEDEGDDPLADDEDDEQDEEDEKPLSRAAQAVRIMKEWRSSCLRKKQRQRMRGMRRG
jgi:hypothetical protein